jgi:hypothetical protein
MKNENILLDLPKSLLAKLSDEYTSILGKTQDSLVSDFDNFLTDYQTKFNLVDDAINALPHPVRKKWLGLLPIHFELGLVDDEIAARAAFIWITQDQARISNFVSALAKSSDKFRDLVKTLDGIDGGTHYGNIDPIIYPHMFCAKGSHHYKLSDVATKMLDETIIPKTIPVGLLSLPRKNMYIEASPDVDVWNVSTQWHNAEGFYLNQYVISNEDVSDEWDRNMNDTSPDNMLRHFMLKGDVKKDGGEIRVIEVLAIGKPKSTIFDDATFNFVLVTQDSTMLIRDLIDAHINYYTGMKDKVDEYEAAGNPESIVKVNHLCEEDKRTFIDCMEFITKALLMINGKNTNKFFNADKTIAIRERKAALSGSKKRKLDRKIPRVYDHVLIEPSHPTLPEKMRGFSVDRVFLDEFGLDLYLP